MGRNIWQNDNPVAVIKAINAIVHEGATEKEALDLFSESKGEDGRAAPAKPATESPPRAHQSHAGTFAVRRSGRRLAEPELLSAAPKRFGRLADEREVALRSSDAE